MKIIDWNICCTGTPESKINYLRTIVGTNCFIAILQEVTPNQYDVLKGNFNNTRYSLDYREPGKFDTRNRRLGVAIICSDDIKIKSASVLTRCLLPERTLLVDVEYKTSMLRIMGMHSITGCLHLNAKSIQFLSWAEAVDEYKPDIVAFDANEPAKDHYDVEQMEFFTNKDNGRAARTFFKTLKDTNLTDSILSGYDINSYVPREPLAVSHQIKRGNQKKRYDFVFTSKTIGVSKCKYCYEEAIKAGSDHALISVDADFGESEEFERRTGKKQEK